MRSDFTAVLCVRFRPQIWEKMLLKTTKLWAEKSTSFQIWFWYRCSYLQLIFKQTCKQNLQYMKCRCCLHTVMPGFLKLLLKSDSCHKPFTDANVCFGENHFQNMFFFWVEVKILQWIVEGQRGNLQNKKSISHYLKKKSISTCLPL